MNVESSEAPVKFFQANELVHRCLGNQVLARRMAGLFLSSMDKEFHNIQTAIDEGDCTRASSLAHRLKGTASTVGANILSQTAFELELSTRASDLSAATAVWHRLLEQVENLQSEVEEFIAS